MKGYYSRHLGPTLAAKIEELAEAPLPEQLTLLEEIAVSRVVATTALKLAEPALDGEVDVPDSTRALAAECLRDAMNHVRDMVAAAAKIESGARDKVSLQAMHLIVLQIVRVIQDETAADEELGKRIEKRISEEVRLPVDGQDVGGVLAGGIASTPDMIAEEMDESVCGSSGEES